FVMLSYGICGQVSLLIGRNDTVFNLPSYMDRTAGMCFPSVSGSNDNVTDTELSDQYRCISAARWAFLKMVTSRSDRTACDLIGNPTTTVPFGSSAAGSIVYPASLNIST